MPEPHWRGVAEFVAHRAASRVRRKRFWRWFPFRSAGAFHEAAEHVLRCVLISARYIIASEKPQGLLSRDGYRMIDAQVRRQVQQHRGHAWADLLLNNDSLRKLLLAAALTWLRIQFPVLNTTAAVTALTLIARVLDSRDT